MFLAPMGTNAGGIFLSTCASDMFAEFDGTCSKQKYRTSVQSYICIRDSYETGVAVLKKIRSLGIGSAVLPVLASQTPPKPSVVACDRHLSAFAGSSPSPNGQRTQMRHPLIHPWSIQAARVALEPPNNASPPSTHMAACGIQNVFKTGRGIA
jgi:hypothetical protein